MELIVYKGLGRKTCLYYHTILPTAEMCSCKVSLSQRNTYTSKWWNNSNGLDFLQMCSEDTLFAHVGTSSIKSKGSSWTKCLPIFYLKKQRICWHRITSCLMTLTCHIRLLVVLCCFYAENVAKYIYIFSIIFTKSVLCPKCRANVMRQLTWVYKLYISKTLYALFLSMENAPWSL